MRGGPMATDINPQEFFDSIRAIAGPHQPSDLALTVARMLAAVRLWPTGRDGVPGFLDLSRELTNADWLAMVEVLAKGWKAGTSRLDNPFGRLPEQPSLAPGTLEQLRRVILSCVAVGGAAPSVPGWLLQSTLELAEPRDLFARGARSADPELRDFIIESVDGVAGTRVFCAYGGAASIALALAGGGADVVFDTYAVALATLCACLGLAADLRLQVRQDDPLRLARAEIVGSPLVPDVYDVSVVFPPFNSRYSPGDDDALGTGLPIPTSGEAAGVTLALARGRKTAVCVLLPSFLFKSARADQVFRERAIRDYGLDTIVGLPRGVFGGASIGGALLLFKPDSTSGARASKSRGVFMIDARVSWDAHDKKTGERIGVARLIRSHEPTDVSVSVPVEELAENDFNLSVERYVLAPEMRRMRELAASATTVALEDIAELYRPQAIAGIKAMAAGAQIEVTEVGVADIDEAGVVRSPSKSVPVTPDVARQARKARLEPGDVLLVIKGSAGKVGYIREIPPDATWLANQSFAILRLRQHAPIGDPRVLFRFLSSPLGQANIQSLRVGSAVPGLQMSDVRRLAIVLPERKEQEAIAGDVEGLFALQDKIQEMRSELISKQGLVWPEGLGAEAPHPAIDARPKKRNPASHRQKTS
jgi:type I restriction enzyme M protein